jgi:outer membrane protein assembly factor BamB
VGLLSFTMHAVVADGRVVFGDLEGKLYCLDSRDGSTVWSRQFPGAFVHAAAISQPEEEADANVIVAACQDGGMYGLDWAGNVLWSVRARRPFVTPAKLEAGIAYAGALDGRMFAVDARTGDVAWTFDAAAAIRQPAAIASGKVFFGSEDMVLHALDAQTGRELWRTERGHFTGQSFRNTWPVVVGDKVMTFQILVDGHAEFIMEALLFNATPGDHREKRLEDWPQEREAILDWLASDMKFAVDCVKSWEEGAGTIRAGSRSQRWAGSPLRKTLYVFQTGGDGNGNAVEPFQVPMGIVGGTGNSNMGPTLDAHGRPILWWRVSARSLFSGGSFGTGFSPDLSGLDLATGDRIILPTTRNVSERRRGGPGMELDNHHMLTAAGDYIYYHNPFRQARWIRLDGRENPTGNISAVYGQHDGGGWRADVVYYKTKSDAGERADAIFDSHGAARTPIVIADDALFVNEIDIRALACYESRSSSGDVHAIEQPKSAATNEAGTSAAAPLENARGEEMPLADATQYVWERRIIRNDDASTTDLRGILEEQVGLVVRAGHLLPYYCKRGELNPRWYFTNPGDTIAALARAYPFVSGELRAELRDYLSRELAAYPPCSDALNGPSDAGTSRMDFVVPPHLWEWDEGRLYRSLPRLHNVYSVWLYADATGDVDYVRNRWDAIKEFYETHRQDRTAYLGGPSGAVAMARLAHLVGDAPRMATFEQEAISALAAVKDEATMREPMCRRYGFRPDWSEAFNFLGFHLLHVTPEVARYLRHRAGAKASIAAHVDQAELHWPMWFVSQASTFTRYYGESHALSPHYSKMIYPVKSLIEQSSPEDLRRWVDAEDAPRGDLFFIERLVLAIEAHGEESWVDVRH